MSDRVGTRPLHSRLSWCAARRVVGRASAVAAHVRHAQDRARAAEERVLHRTRCRGVGDCSTPGGAGRHGGQRGRRRPAGARILPAPVNAGPGRGARRSRFQQSESANLKAPRPAWVSLKMGSPGPLAGSGSCLAGRLPEGAPAGAVQRHCPVRRGRPGRLPRPRGTGQDARVSSYNHAGLVQPAAALPWRWRWILDRRHAMITLPRPSSWLQCR